MNPDTDRLARIEACLRRALQPTQLTLVDDSHRHVGHAGARGGGHYSVTIVAPIFFGKSLIARHRLVYDAVSALMHTDIHALSIQAMTAEEAASIPQL